MINALIKRIESATTVKDFIDIIEHAEPRQENGHKTTFARHLDNVNWYFD
jgi:hypothetical protein